MRIVIDANILISALLRDSMTRAILLYPGFDFASPFYLREEIEEHEVELIKRVKVTTQEFKELIEMLLGSITIFDEDRYSDKMDAAEMAIGKIDLDDVPYLALAMAIQADAIWSDDKHFEQQNSILLLTTEKMAAIYKNERKRQ